MSPAWFGQLYLNESGGGFLYALPLEAAQDWKAGEDEYEQLCEADSTFQLRDVRASRGLFVGDDEGIHEAHFFRAPGHPELMLAVWAEWVDPKQATLPLDEKQLAKSWAIGHDPRQAWLTVQATNASHSWERLGWVAIPSGVVLLGHAEYAPVKSKLGNPTRIAKGPQMVLAGLAPGEYAVETLTLCELPEGENLCFLARWIQRDGSSEMDPVRWIQ
jgi:hypothetical protein